MATQQTIKTNPERLWESLMTMAAIGATAKGGCNRQALTDDDQQGRQLFIQWCVESGCSINVDQMGNIFARREGLNPELPPVITGSHLDTQPTGGKYDGVYGVLAGLEVMRTLNDHNIQTQTAIETVVWTNEEGARFSPAMIGSGVWCGEFDLEYGHSRKDKEAHSIKGELNRIGFLGETPCKAKPITAAFEAHIEQGPILEQKELQIGVVSGVQGMNWYDLTLTGKPCHAGPSPMESRNDPFMALANIVNELYALAEEYAPWSRVTFGDIKAEPGSRNTVPEQLVLAIDLRHPDQKTLDTMDQRMREIVKREAQRYGLSQQIREEWRSPAVVFDEDCVNAVAAAVKELGLSHQQMFSGAGHDSVYVSRVAPTSMIFVPCKDGLSHNEAEEASSEDLTAGCDVLLNAMIQMANKAT